MKKLVILALPLLIASCGNTNSVPEAQQEQQQIQPAQESSTKLTAQALYSQSCGSPWLAWEASSITRCERKGNFAWIQVTKNNIGAVVPYFWNSTNTAYQSCDPVPYGDPINYWCQNPFGTSSRVTFQTQQGINKEIRFNLY